MGIMKKTFFSKLDPPTQMIEQFVEFASRVRREGILSLEPQLKDVKDDFLRKALQRFAEPTAVGLAHDPSLEHEHKIRICAQVKCSDDHGGQQSRKQPRCPLGGCCERGTMPQDKTGHRVAHPAQRKPHERDCQWHVANFGAKRFCVVVAAEKPTAR